ncbi:MAG TPA: twin-arginine translocation signal domain-containing protein [Pyrinomonadaceae bacterium]|jgi:hypothetical protein
MTSRRNFLKHGTLGAIAAGFSLGIGDKTKGGAAWASSGAPLGLNRAAFATQLQTTFWIKQGPRRIPLKLIEVVDLGSKKTLSGEREAFALVLRGSDATPLEQETYTIEHEKLGIFSFLVVPVISRDTNARYYEININRLHG